MKKLKKKAEALKLLSDQMSGSCGDHESGGVKAVIQADSKEGLIEASKKLPEILSKVEKIKKKLKK